MCLAHDGSIFLIAWLKGFGRICFPGGFRLKEYLLSIKKGLSRIWLWPAWCSGPQQFSPIGAQTTISYEPVFCRPEIRPYFLMAALASSSLAMAAALSASAFSLRD